MSDKDKDEILGVVVGSIFGWPLAALELLWFNYIFFRPMVPFYKWLALAVPVILIGFIVPQTKWFLRLVLAAALLLQVMKWCHMIAFPVFGG